MFIKIKDTLTAYLNFKRDIGNYLFPKFTDQSNYIGPVKINFDFRQKFINNKVYIIICLVFLLQVKYNFLFIYYFNKIYESDLRN